MSPVQPWKRSDAEPEGKELSSIECEDLGVTKSEAKNLVRAYQSKDVLGNTLASVVFLLISVLKNLAHVFVAMNSCDVIFYECSSCIFFEHCTLIFFILYALVNILFCSQLVFSYFA